MLFEEFSTREQGTPTRTLLYCVLHQLLEVRMRALSVNCTASHFHGIGRTSSTFARTKITKGNNQSDRSGKPSKSDKSGKSGKSRSKERGATSINNSRTSRNPLQMDVLNLPNRTSGDYWDKMGEGWNDEIMCSLEEDIVGIIMRRIDEHCRADRLTIDFGCGVGKFLPSLAQRSQNVLGLDISRRLLAIARRTVVENHNLNNVRLKRADLGTCNLCKMGVASNAAVAMCANVLISPESATRRAIVRNIAKSLTPGTGILLLVVPAIKSARLCKRTHTLWLAELRRRCGKRFRLRPEHKPETTCDKDERRGIFCRDGVRTKHYGNAEIRTLLRDEGFAVLSTEPVDYSWSTEFDELADWLDETVEARPHDTLVVARRLAPSRHFQGQGVQLVAAATGATGTRLIGRSVQKRRRHHPKRPSQMAQVPAMECVSTLVKASRAVSRS